MCAHVDSPIFPVHLLNVEFPQGAATLPIMLEFHINTGLFLGSLFRSIGQLFASPSISYSYNYSSFIILIPSKSLQVSSLYFSLEGTWLFFVLWSVL